MDIDQRLSQAFAEPGQVLEQVLDLVQQAFPNITARFYHVGGNHAASLMAGGQAGPGQRNFMPTVHVVIGETESMITWSDAADEDLGGISTVPTDVDELAARICKVLLATSGSQPDYAYDLDDEEPSDEELAELDALQGLV